MSDKHASNGTTAIDAPLATGSDREQVASSVAKPGFLRRYRLPLLLAVVAICLYAGSILYILYGRGQIA
ncbi:MAG: hypothetical protein AB8B87_02855 [Granulosicoccus sp.]